MIKKIYQAPDKLVSKIVKFSELRNVHLLIAIPMFVISWLIYNQFFMVWFDFTWRFVPTFLLGFVTCLLLLKYIPKQNQEVMPNPDVVEAVERLKKEIAKKLNPSGDIDFDYIMYKIDEVFGVGDVKRAKEKWFR